MASLKGLRKGVDGVDRRILGLLNRRMKYVAGIAKVKKAAGIPVYAPEREDMHLRALASANRGPIKADAMRAIYREIFSASRAAEQGLTIAYLGPEGTFTHLAALRRFGSQSGYLPCRSVGDVFAEVDRGRADYGVVPIENSTEGVVNHTLDMFTDSDLKICAEELMPIHHVLMAKGGTMASIKVVYTHSNVLGQCRNWLEDNLRNARTVAAPSTSEAAKMAGGQPGAAAIGTELAARLYGMKVLARDIEDMSGNFTRFLVIGRQWSPRTGRDKTSVMFSIKDRVGALYDMLVPFKRNRINLASIESRPSRKKAWDYYFFIDCLGHADDPKVSKALKDLEKVCVFVKLLGSYPAAEPLSR